MSDSWEAFADVLTAEAAAFADLHRTTLLLTRSLVENNIPAIKAATEQVELSRRVYHSHASQRRMMQRRGFGKMSLKEVCTYAPRALAQRFQLRLSEIVYYATSLRITNDNNKALSFAGMERLLKIVEVLQRNASEQTGTYRRRGLHAKKDASVIVSQRA